MQIEHHESGIKHYDFFVSYTAADQAWAKWIAWKLEEAGLTTFVQAWDIGTGDNFVAEMHHALSASDRVLIVLSPSYLESKYGEAEWTAKFDHSSNTVVPVRVRECKPAGLLSKLVYVDLAGLPDADAAQRLLSEIRTGRLKPDRAPVYPGRATEATGPDAKRKRFPGALPAIWQVPLPRNPNFTGRAELLEQVHTTLSQSGTAAVTALAGLAGIGKTQLALEYAYRYASDYDLIWWVRAETETSLAGDLAALSARLFPDLNLGEQPALIKAGLDWLAHNSGWLLVFDNSPGPASCEPYVPHGTAG